MLYDRALALFQQHLPQEAFRPQPASDWSKGEPLPPEIAVYYERVGPDDVELQPFPDPIFLPDLRGLWTYQEHHEYNISTWERQVTWRDDWFFLVDLQNVEYGHLVFDAPSGQVLKVTYSAEGWIARPLFRTLDTMALVLAILVTPVAQPQTSERSRPVADVSEILAQLRAILFEQELRMILTELKWQHTPADL